MFKLKTIALKLFRAATTQIITSISIIAVSVCLIMTMSLYIWNAKTQMDEEMQALFGDAEMFVGYNPDQKQSVTADQVAAIEAMEGVIGVSPILLAHTNVEGQLPRVYTVGVEDDALVKSRYHFEGNIQANEVVISQKIAKLFKKDVGDTIDIEFEPYVVKEILTQLPGGSDVEMAIFANDTVKKWLSVTKQDVGKYALIDLHKTASPETITQLLTKLDSELRIDVVNEEDFIKRNFQALAIFMVVLSVFVLVITSVLLMSTFQLVLFKLKEQLTVLRALGATAKQVGQLVQAQLMAILSIGLVLGVLFSLAIIKLWLPLLVDKMQLPPARTEFPIWLALVIAVVLFVVLLVIIQWQVKKSMRLLPLQIVADNHETTLRFTKGRLIAIGSVTVIAFLCFLMGMVEGNSGESALQILIGSILITLIILYMMPYLFIMLLKIGLQPVRMLLGKEAYLACQQLMPQVRKNMPIVLSIIGLMVILIFRTTLLKSVKEGEKDYIGLLFEAPVAITNDLYNPTFTNDVVKEIEALPSVDYAYARSSHPLAELYLDGDWDAVNFQAVDIMWLIERGEIPEIVGPVDEGMIVTTDFAKLEGLAIGDEIRLGVYSNELLQVEEIAPTKVVAIVEPKYKGDDIFFDWSSEIVQAVPDEFLTVQDIMVQTSDIKQTLSELSFLHERWPALTFSDYDTYKVEMDRMYYQRWSLFVGVLIVLVVATCLGVIQTLLHTIYGKRADYAIQRLIGLTPNGLIKLILSQVLSFVLYGLAVGTLIGTAFTKLLALVDPGGAIVFDFRILLGVSVFFLLTVVIIFSVQGYWISRKTLANELVE